MLTDTPTDTCAGILFAGCPLFSLHRKIFRVTLLLTLAPESVSLSDFRLTRADAVSLCVSRFVMYIFSDILSYYFYI
nr:MAG TPA: hypothetical protein [Caudoviricetes sp.]